MTTAHESSSIVPSISGGASSGTKGADGNTRGQGSARPHAKSLNSGQNANPNFPPPKTDKPRPHVCATCTRSFARLEHLKRHERSHTKEKPFACPECTRCFARRDLLLRHQQKLHLTALPPSRQRGARRESTSSAAPGGSTRVRKNSIANNTSGTAGASAMRPRANTISHVDGPTLGLLAAANSSASRHEAIGLGLGHHGGINGFSHGLPGVGTYPLRGMSAAAGHHGNPHVLPKLETKHQTIDIGASLRTAPPYGGFGGDIDMDSILYGPGTTVNPAQLHFSSSPQNLAFEMPQSPYQQGFSGAPSAQSMMDEGTFAWMTSFDNQLSFNEYNEQAIDGSSPSVISTGSPDGMSEVMLDGSNNPMSASGAWQNAPMSQAAFPPAYSMDLSGQTFPDLYPPSQLSPKSLNANIGSSDQYFSSPPLLSSQTPLSLLPGMSHHYFRPSMTNSSDTPSNSAASISSSNRQSSVTSVSTDSITDTTRQALLTSLSQPSMFRQRKTSHPQVSSPLSPGFSSRSRSTSSVSLPSTCDLQRYVAAYIQYFHPHLPFLHIPSLSFDSPAFNSSLRASSGHLAYGQSSIAGGGGSLILAMAAVGALYEYDLGASKELFEMAKKMIHLYLDERRKADMSAALNGNHGSNESYAQNTPLWLVQAMLLNVIYGHNCGDKTAAGIASTHCAALVSLARAAGLTKPLPGFHPGLETIPHIKQEDAQMGGDEWNGAGSYTMFDAQNEWHYWKLGEERKRTLYAVFILSSLLVSAYNHAPALMNSEIGLDLPCDESLWAADSAETWRSLRGAAISDQRSPSFASALSSLLTASHRPQQGRYGVRQACDPHNMKFEDLPESDIQPSTFGCLILINALHNYIWETRQRHMGREWTPEETKAMHDRIKPALRAWQAAWSCSPEHSIERPNPFGASSLSADCIPLLDLAYVRLHVNLGRSKEAFFRRDFDTMADELACGNEFVQHAGHSPRSSPGSGGSNVISSSTSASPNMNSSHVKLEDSASADVTVSLNVPNGRSGECTTREKQLFLAAELAVNALIMANKLGVTFADFSSRELPLQSALCAFDCAQVLAEWVSTVQERVGRYLGILGRDAIDFTEVPGIMLMGDKDLEILEKVNEVLSSAEMKLADSGAMATTGGPNMEDCGYGSKILLVHARMFEKAAVWPVTREMSQSLRIQAAHIKVREEASINPST
ncbi:MAG: hypothetical protein ASARMPREDX12_000207 [Alectoria sarmentosa]|nr:MAG: hypothetical protein ASARMPREDX12_000207 [Alectoria sarmentosa]